MRITVHGGNDMARALEGWAVPAACDELIIDAPKAARFTNCLLGSSVNCRVTVTPTELDSVSYAGLFALCGELQHQPTVDMEKCVNAAAMFKQCGEMRFSVYPFRNTANVRDMRQCFWGCTWFSGNGLQFWDFSGLASPDSMRNFAGQTKFQTRVYDGIIENLYAQAVAGTLPTPMSSVNFGSAIYSPRVKEMRQHLVDYGWEIIDGGEVPYELSPLEIEFSRSVDQRLATGNFPGDIDLSPVVRTARNGILISPRHVLYVRHYQPTPGQMLTFWNGEQATVAKCVPGGWDIAVATLSTPVSIRPALVFPPDWQERMPLLAGPPTRYPDGTRPAMVWFNQNKQVGVADLSYADDKLPWCQAVISSDALRKERFIGVRTGDSGSPFCCVTGDRLVVAFAVSTSNGNGVFTGSVTQWLSGVTDGAVETL